MEDYLKGYLEVLPAYQRAKIQDIIRDNTELYQFTDISEEEFKEMMDRLAKDHQQLTRVIPQEDKVDPDLYNAYYSNVHVDLNLMFMENHLIESALANYGRIFDGIISDLNKEVGTLREKVNSLRLVNEGEDGLIVKSYSFDTKEQMETDISKYSHLFTDRDGSEIPVSVIERNHDQYYITLSKTQEIDLVRDKEGRATASIEIVDRRGTPVKTTSESKYSLDKAIDGSEETYWAEVVLVEQPLNVSMEK